MKPESKVCRARFASFEVDFSQKEIRKNGLRLHLQNKPFHILEILLEHPGTLVTREELAQRLWPHSQVSVDHSLNTAVNSLRQTLGDSQQRSHLIETRTGLGYVFIAPVEPIYSIGSRLKSPSNDHDYLRGCFLLDKMAEEDASRAVVYFESALLDNPRSALAFTGLSDAWCEFGRLALAPTEVASRKAHDYAVLALSSNSELAESHAAMGRAKALFDWDWKGAESEYLRALEIDPNNALTQRGYAEMLTLQGKFAQALNHIHVALEQEPLSRRTLVEKAWSLYLSGEYEDAVSQCWHILGLEPRLWQAQLILAFAYQSLGMIDEGITEAANAVTCSGRHPIAVAAMSYSDSGQAQSMLNELAQQSDHRYVPPLSFAIVHDALGQISPALAFAEQAWRQRDCNLTFLSPAPAVAALSAAAGRRVFPQNLLLKAVSAR